MKSVSNQVLAVDSFTSRTKTLCSPSGQTPCVTTASTSGYASINNKLVIGRQGPHSLAIAKTTTSKIPCWDILQKFYNIYSLLFSY